MAQQPPSDSTPFVELTEKILALSGKENTWLKKETTKLAEKIAKDSPIFDELCWFVAEADLQVRNSYALYGQKKFSNVGLALPTDANIRLLAEAISTYHNNLEDLHWQLAERRILAELLAKLAK
jgi:hypothetical protein